MKSLALGAVFTVLAAAGFGHSGAPPATPTTPDRSLDATQRELAEAREVVLGRIPLTGGANRHALMLQDLTRAPDAQARLEWLYAHGSTAGRAYALCGLSRVSVAAFVPRLASSALEPVPYHFYCTGQEHVRAAWLMRPWGWCDSVMSVRFTEEDFDLWELPQSLRPRGLPRQ